MQRSRLFTSHPPTDVAIDRSMDGLMRIPEVTEVKAAIQFAIADFQIRDKILLETGLNERTISHSLAVHLKDFHRGTSIANTIEMRVSLKVCPYQKLISVGQTLKLKQYIPTLSFINGERGRMSW